MGDWFFSSWQTIGYVIITTALVYCSALFAVRLAGRRTVANISAFDAVITIALGSVIASTVVAREPSYAQGMTALVTLLVMQVAAAALRQRFAFARRLLDFSPRIVARGGEFDTSSSPLGPQMTREELLSKLRERGVFDINAVHVVILEPGGGLSVSAEAVDVDDAVATAPSTRPPAAEG